MKKRYPELDALRGLAAILVVFFHYTMEREQASLGFDLGTTGVDLFFIISGFVILLSLEHVKNARQFIANRISRLYPTYWASVSVTFACMLAYAWYTSDYSSISIVQYLANLTMFQYYLKIRNIDGPYWTMIIEMVFYLFMVGLYYFKLLRKLDTICVSLICFTVAIVHIDFENIWTQRFFFKFPFVQFLPLFYAGTLFYRKITKGVKDFKFFGLLLFCLVAQILLFEYAGRSNSFITVGEYAGMLGGYFTLFLLFIYNRLRFIVNKLTLFLGKISYALYLIHQKLSIEYIIPKLTNTYHMGFWSAALTALALVVVIATLITYLVEIPYSSKMRRNLYVLLKINRTG